MSSILNIALSGIRTANKNLATTAHNTTNVGTPGYSRQHNIQVANYPAGGSGGFFGSGSSITNVTRYYSSHLETQLRNSYTETYNLASYYEHIREVDDMLAGENSGLSTLISSFFSSMDAVSQNPNDIAIRNQFLAAANALTGRMRTADARLDEINTGINEEMVAAVEQMNAFAQNIAKLNKQIVMLRGNGGAEPNDLLDQREYYITELSKLVNIEVYEDPMGMYNVFFGTGQQLVWGEQSLQLGTRVSPLTSEVQVITYDNNVGEIEIPEGVITGGKLGGLITTRREGVDVAKNHLGAIAVGLQQIFNSQHQLGMDMNGNDGQIFFKPLSPVVNGNLHNTGTASVSARFITPSELLANTTPAGGYFLEKTSTGYTLFESDGITPIKSFTALPVEHDGLVIQLTATLETGDRFELTSTGVVPDMANRGTGGITVNVSNVQPSDYLLKKTATGYSLLRQSDNTYIPVPGTFPTTPMIVDGMEISVPTGAMDKNDNFLIRPTHDIADMFAVNITDPKELAIAFSFRTEAATANTGTGVISAGKVNALPPLSVNAPNIRQTVNIVFANPPTQFQINGGPLIAYTPGMPISQNGWTIELSGVPNAGDTFTISENLAGVADNRNSLELFNLQTQKLVMGGVDNFNGVYKNLVSDIGIKTNLSYQLGLAEEKILEQRQEARENLSGVDLEEEGVNLVKYTQALQAASKVLQTASTLFDNILQAIR